MNALVITKAILEQHKLSDDEYKKILEILGREPNWTELGMFSAMWSEHCSYKSSRIHLKKLPTTGPRVVQGPGENAGAVDIGDGLCACSRWSLTTILLSSSPTRVRRRGWVEFYAIFLRWALGRLRC